MFKYLETIHKQSFMKHSATKTMKRLKTFNFFLLVFGQHENKETEFLRLKTIKRNH